MLLNIVYQDKVYNFEVQTFRDDQAERIYFLIKILNGKSLLVEKKSNGTWSKLSNGLNEIQLEEAIFRKIDDTSVIRLIENALPYNTLNKSYLD